MVCIFATSTIPDTVLRIEAAAFPIMGPPLTLLKYATPKYTIATVANLQQRFALGIPFDRHRRLGTGWFELAQIAV